jgi:hypothetical protein
MVCPVSWSVRHAEGRILRGETLARATASFSWSALDFGSIGDLDDRLGKLHRLEDHRAWPDRTACRRCVVSFRPASSDDVAGEGLLDVLAVVGVHRQHAADALLLVACVELRTRRAGLERAGIDAAEGERADERVVHDLEGEHRKGSSSVGWRSTVLLGLEVDALDRRATSSGEGR